MAAPAFRAGSATVGGVATGTTVTAGYPAGIVAGDILVLAAQQDSNGTLTTDASWTLVTTRTAGAAYIARWWWKRADGTETGSVTVTSTVAASSTVCLSATILAFSGCIPTGTPYEGASLTSGTVSPMTALSTTTAAAERLVVNLFCVGDNLASAPSVAGYTEAYDLGTTASNDAQFTVSVYTSAAAETKAGDSRTLSASTPWAAFNFALIPAPELPPTARVTGSQALVVNSGGDRKARLTAQAAHVISAGGNRKHRITGELVHVISSVRISGAGAGTLGFTGAASGTAEAPAVEGVTGTAAGTIAFTGAAAGTHSAPAGVTGTGAATLTVTGSAIGAHTQPGISGTGAGTIAFNGVGGGSHTAPAITGTAAGVLVFNGAGSGAHTAPADPVTGTGAGTITFRGTAIGTGGVATRKSTSGPKKPKKRTDPYARPVPVVENVSTPETVQAALAVRPRSTIPAAVLPFDSAPRGPDGEAVTDNNLTPAPVVPERVPDWILAPPAPLVPDYIASQFAVDPEVLAMFEGIFGPLSEAQRAAIPRLVRLLR